VEVAADLDQALPLPLREVGKKLIETVRARRHAGILQKLSRASLGTED
jgi:hypothetical protein